MTSNVRDLNRLNSANVLSIAEALEARRLLDASCDDVPNPGGGGTHKELRIEGTAFNDTIDVRSLFGLEGRLNGGAWVACANATLIRIRGMDGADTIGVGNGITIKAIIGGDEGGDSIVGGDGDDEINGDAGVDWIFGGAGNDLINGGADADHLHGDDGSDTLIGGSGHDYMWGELGDDYFSAQDGELDEIYGGDGYDTVSSYDHTDPQDVLSSIESGTD